MKGKFSVSQDSCTTGFQTHAVINPELPIDGQLHRRKLYFRQGLDKGNSNELMKIIEWNSSLRIAFGWSFESSKSFEDAINDCNNLVTPVFVGDIVEIISDNRCDWFGFAPFNVFTREYYKAFCLEDLIIFNNNLIDYQTKFVEAFTQHTSYRHHAFLRDERYRYNFFKKIRQNPIALSDAFQYYIDAAIDTTGLKSIPRDIVEQMIGCHFLYHPEVFFESLEFNVLKGTIYE